MNNQQRVEDLPLENLPRLEMLQADSPKLRTAKLKLASTREELMRAQEAENPPLVRQKKVARDIALKRVLQFRLEALQRRKDTLCEHQKFLEIDEKSLIQQLQEIGK